MDQPPLPLGLAPSTRLPRAKPTPRAEKGLDALAKLDPHSVSHRLVLVTRTLCFSRTGFTAGLVAERSGVAQVEAEGFLKWAERQRWCVKANGLDRPHPDRGAYFYVGRL
jgi:hypothetical protein